MWFRASTPGLKGDFFDLPLKAWKKHIKEYIKLNPIFAWSHQYVSEGFCTLPNVMGHAADYRIIDEGDPKRDGLYLLDDFAYGINPMATMAWEFYMRGDLNAVSVGFTILEFHTEQRPNGKDDRDIEVWVSDETLLLEHSACMLPLDTDALAVGRSLPQEFAARARAYADEAPDIEAAMRAYAAGDDALADAFRAVLADDYCASLLCSAGKKGEFKPAPELARLAQDEDDYVRGIVRETVKEVFAELYREKAVFARDPGFKAVDSPAFEEVTPAPEIPDWKRKLAEMAELNETMTSEELRARLDEIKHEVAT